MNIHNFTFVDRKFLRRENYRRCKFGDLSFPYRRIENSWDKIIQVRDDLVYRIDPFTRSILGIDDNKIVIYSCMFILENF